MWMIVLVYITKKLMLLENGASFLCRALWREYESKDVRKVRTSWVFVTASTADVIGWVVMNSRCVVNISVPLSIIVSIVLIVGIWAWISSVPDWSWSTVVSWASLDWCSSVQQWIVANWESFLGRRGMNLV